MQVQDNAKTFEDIYFMNNDIDVTEAKANRERFRQGVLCSVFQK